MAGLALAYAPGLTDQLSFLIRQFTTLETDMVSAERLFNFAQLAPEETAEQRQACAPVEAGWPHAGAITFEGVAMRYREGLKPVLQGLDLSLRAGEKVGLVGRTGAGKSSILVCLYRIVELSAGRITIDGRDIAHVPLRVLRARLSIIPQDLPISPLYLPYISRAPCTRAAAAPWTGCRPSPRAAAAAARRAHRTWRGCRTAPARCAAARRSAHRTGRGCGAGCR